MAFTEKEYNECPSFEELTVQEVELTSPYVRAGAIHCGTYCDEVSKEFMLCRSDSRDPRRCLEEGKAVTACGIEFYQKVKANCASEFTDFGTCIDYGDRDLTFKRCRKPQAAFDKCMKDKLGMERPPIGFFSQLRIHKTSRPRYKPKDMDLPEPATKSILSEERQQELDK